MLLQFARSVDRPLDEEGGFEPRQARTAGVMLADTSFVEEGEQAQIAFVSTPVGTGAGVAGVQRPAGQLLPPDDDPVSVELFYEDERGEASRREIVLSFGAVTRATSRRWARGWGRGAGSTPPSRRSRVR